MLISHSIKHRPAKKTSEIAQALEEVSARSLREYVELVSFPRHYVAEHQANLRARDLLADEFKRLGYSTHLQGRYDNIIALPKGLQSPPKFLLGAHYDTAPGTPGADDNGSAIAVCLEIARILKGRNHPTMFAIFNREEDGLLGSDEYVRQEMEKENFSITEAHIFEMVGFCSHAKKSQTLPAGLPVSVPDTGDFLALLSNKHSNSVSESILKLAATYLPEFPVLGLKTYFGIEKHFSHLLRSDHAPFWHANIPTVMWTDTSEFRNPHYHRASDTPDTLDYEFMKHVTKLVPARLLQ